MIRETNRLLTCCCGLWFYYVTEMVINSKESKIFVFPSLVICLMVSSYIYTVKNPETVVLEECKPSPSDLESDTDKKIHCGTGLSSS